MDEIIDANTALASILDKTDWRKSIHRYLDYCVSMEGSVKYPKAVKQLVSAVAAEFPNWDAKKIINEKIDQLNKEYDQAIKESIDKHPDDWAHPGKRQTIEPEVINSYYKQIYEFIKDILAQKRMLLWGVKKPHGGTQLEEIEY